MGSSGSTFSAVPANGYHLPSWSFVQLEPSWNGSFKNDRQRLTTFGCYQLDLNPGAPAS